MFDRIAASFHLARSSWDVLRTDKKLIVFPVLSGLGCLLVLLSFALPFVAHPQWLDFDQPAAGGARVGGVPWWVYAVAFAYYFCNYFVIVFCNAALISCALIRFNGEEPNLGDGFRAAASRLPQIVAWALVSATVGVILKVIENAHEKAGQIISAILGTAWTVITYFVVPVLVVEGVGPFQAIQRSLSLLRKTWGEALVGRLGLGLFLFLLFLPFLGLAVLGGFLCTKALGVGLAVVALAAVYLLVWMAVGSALQGIFLGALYQYAAHGRTPAGFDPASLEGAFQPKR
jgi:hypothetical protein